MAPRPPPPPIPNPDNPHLVGAIEAMIAAMQQQNANMIGENCLAAGSSQASLPRVQEWSLEDFLQYHPSRFDGKVSPDGADQWMRDMERIFDAKRCPAENRLAYTEYLLAGEVVHCVRYAKEVEFLQLTQGEMSVSEYAEKFKHLGRFHTLKMAEEW
ncbi:uncharacterized protein LOC114175464 [Vigna unguiculata]|uniref:uncharacterized protein LOC114175464 n=1 Tax=Vigna unguiculata TaxID=3917 RepID=UPI001015DBB5|nr:uncharacterized protein LOC114175464 [Vigna unguiculata]